MRNKTYRTMHKTLIQHVMKTLLVFASIFSTSTWATAINDITYTTAPGNRMQIVISLDSAAPKPLSFTIDNPARIAIDLPNTVSMLKQRTTPIGAGVADSITAVSSKNKTRLIVNLAQLVPYKVSTNNNQVILSLNSDSGIASTNTLAGTTKVSSPSKAGTRGINKIDFRRGEKGEGRVFIQLSDSSIPMDVSEQNGKVIVRFIGANLPSNLHQRLDVTDFATPVKSIDSFVLDNAARIEIEPVDSNFEHLAYQTDKLFTVELRPMSKKELEDIKKQKFGYVGERLSLNFQDIPIRAVLQLIADFTNLNIVVSDTVDGNLTLRLKNVPWDQALDIILKAKGLDKRENGNVLLVAPSEEIAAQEKIELEARQQASELAPLRTGHFQVNFAKVADLQKLFKGEGNEKGLLSDRGQVIIDERTNTLTIKDTDDVLNEIRRLLVQLDIPVRQVLIESRIVIANDDFAKELGVRFGANSVNASGNGIRTTSGSFRGTQEIINQASDNILAGNPITPLAPPVGGFTDLAGAPGADRLNVNMPVVGAAGSIAFSILSGGNLLDLELSARQAENKSEIVASPRVVTADRNEAFIESGVEIPYETASSSGATTISFKKAVLSIKVKPHITPDDRIIMDLAVNKDAVGEVYAGIPSIDTREIQTQVLVNNGDTVVLGGIYESASTNELDKVPLLADLPLIGSLFRHTFEKDEKAELLIFVTPKILKESLSL